MKATNKYTLFWGGVFSQWYDSPFVDVNDIKYTCAEQYMMSKKALLFGDEEINDLIMEANHPGDMKRLGRKVSNFDWDVWASNALNIVYQGSIFKYEQNPEQLTELMNTKGTILVEASPYDRVWGIGLSEDDPKCLDSQYWEGNNWLGYTLTNVRDNYFKV